jgi:hypothetical protein
MGCDPLLHLVSVRGFDEGSRFHQKLRHFHVTLLGGDVERLHVVLLWL